MHNRWWPVGVVQTALFKSAISPVAKAPDGWRTSSTSVMRGSVLDCYPDVFQPQRGCAVGAAGTGRALMPDSFWKNDT